MDRRSSWMPACSLDVLRIRAAVLEHLRGFFNSRGYLEVETPCLSPEVILDAWIDPFHVPDGPHRPPLYLQTSPEAFMKRLLAAGSGSIYQVAKVFRQAEIGERHNPEFTMIEWYGVGDTWEDQLNFTEQLVRHCLAATAHLPGSQTPAWPTTPFQRLTYADAFQHAFNLDVHQASNHELLAAAKQAHVTLPETGPPLDRDDLLNLMLGFVIEPTLGGTVGAESPVFLCDYPPSQAALAVVSNTTPPVARRFELYVRGLELCNGYQELTDPTELRRRETHQHSRRQSASQTQLPGAPTLAAAIASGLPPCSGVALGFDRLIMLATNANSIQTVLPFPLTTPD